LKLYLRTGKNISVQPLIIKPGMLSIPTDLDGLRRLIALKSIRIRNGRKR
jgi:hypothetical protein